MQPSYDHQALERMFAGLVEQAFCVEVGVCDPKLNDYLVAMLVDFTHVDRLYAIRDARGRQLNQITEMLAVLEEERGAESQVHRRRIYRHIGDFALFWAGVYPEGLSRNRRAVSADWLIDYVDHGKNSYGIAASLFDEDSQPPSSLLRRLGEEFEICAHGLGLVRRGWERSGFEGLGEGRDLPY